MNRTLKYNNNKAVELIKQFKTLSLEVKELSDKITALEEERNKVAIKGQKVKDRLNPIVKNLTKTDEQEYEIVTKVEANEDQLEVTFTNMMEEWKDAWKKRQAEGK